MKILVSGGIGVIGEGVIPELIARGHSIRLLSPNAREDAKQWPDVEPHEGDAADAADRCDAVLHIGAGGLRNIVDAATRASVRRFVYVAPDTGTDDTELLTASRLQWTIVRPGTVYGPGDEVISPLLEMVRALRVVPIAGGDQELRPIWYQDLARILAAVIERNDLARQTLEAPGPEITTLNDLVRRFIEITGRKVLRVPVPSVLAPLVIDTNESGVRGRRATEEVRVQSTPLDAGLRMLADALPEALPEEGVGALTHKTFFAEMRGARHTAASLMTLFRHHVNEFMPLEFAAEPGVPERIERGVTLTGALPLRGNFQMRVEVAEPTHVVLATIEGHPLHGIVEFRTSEENGVLRFSIDNYARAANAFDWMAVKTIGAPAQDANWRAVVQRVIDASGGSSDGVHQESETLDDAAAAKLEQRVKKMVQDRKRNALRAAQ